MKNKNGYTLVEILIVVTLVAVLLIIFIPILGKAFKQSKNKLNEMDKNSLIDSAKVYVNNLINNGYNIVSTNHYDSSCNLINTTQNNNKASYKVGNDELSGYNFIEYAARNDLIITSEYLVKNDYFDPGCIYDNPSNSCEKSTTCKVDKTCALVVHFESNRVKANPNCTGDSCEYYYTLGDYSINIQDESKCKIK